MSDAHGQRREWDWEWWVAHAATLPAGVHQLVDEDWWALDGARDRHRMEVLCQPPIPNAAEIVIGAVTFRPMPESWAARNASGADTLFWKALDEIGLMSMRSAAKGWWFRS